MIDGVINNGRKGEELEARRVSAPDLSGKKALYPGTAGGGKKGMRRTQAPGQGSAEEAPGA